MTSKGFTTRAFVISPDDEQICLTYRLTADPLKSDCFQIEICQTGYMGEDQASGALRCGEREAVELADLFAANSVFPISLPDLLEDRLLQ